MAAAKKPARAVSDDGAPDVVTVERDGVEVQVNVAYMRSWPGIRQAARMQSAEIDQGERFLALVDYYEHVIPNIDEVSEALGGSSAEAADVLAFLSGAVKEATPKN